MNSNRVGYAAMAWALSGLGAFAQPASPSFDCSKAKGEIEKLVCSDAGLAALDRKMADVFATALKSWPADEVAKQKAMQRGWIKGRNDCWKADDKRACAETEYRRRIVEVQIQSGALMAPKPVEYSCTGGEDATKPFVASFYQDTDPPSAVLTYGSDQTIAFLQPSGSGAKYTAPNMEFWEHQGEATVDWYGTKLTCKAP
jgi:uncharacterized protein